MNQKGIDFYNRLINECLKYDIVPMITVYHWDLPQALQDQYGGWEDRRIVSDFVRYAKTIFAAFGDRVKYWIIMIDEFITEWE